MPCPRQIAKSKNSPRNFNPLPEEKKPLFEAPEPKGKDYRSGVTKNQPER